MKVSSVNKIERKLYLISGGIMSLNTRFSIYRYETFYNIVMKKLYNHRRARIELQNHMKKRRTVLGSNEYLKVRSTAETSTSTSWFKEKLDRELDKYMSEVIDSTAESSTSTSSYKEKLDRELDKYMSEVIDSTAEPSTSTSSYKEKLDGELDKYMSEVIDSTAAAELSFTSDSSSPTLQECVNQVDGPLLASNNRGNVDILHQNTSELATCCDQRNDKEPTKEDLDRELDEYMSAVRMNIDK